MRCLQCDYDLNGLTEHRCPECGRGFDPENPVTFLDTRWIEEQLTPPLRFSIYAACFPIVVVVALILLTIAIDWTVGRDAAQSPGPHELIACIFNAALICIPMSMLLVLMLQFGALVQSWSVGWRLRRRVLVATGTSVAIWIVTYGIAAILISVLHV